MIFFGILYVFSVLFIPAYIPVSQMEMPIETAAFTELLLGTFFMMLAILIGFLFKTYNIKKSHEVN